ncbi:sarcosine oxidase subunit gamma [Epibacterium ulvae]|uniref:sarcosine oxidase subunit gamma n=1 Tax=Epibacterium ulvae TaxID=1156985 RepID=UPI001BFC3178|nr:sarcosine oxidase subunit gamma [Epibacterium ulvae]MBT8153664.1 sarcosine oxidase subunit gamma [Epibacterium ulvae]
MTDLSSITALGAQSPWAEIAGALQMSEDTNLGLASLALPKEGAQPSPFDLILPDVGIATTNAGYGAFWTGPNQWMIEGYGHGEPDFAAAVKAQAPDCYVTEQTDGWCAFDVRSQDDGALDALLQRLVNLDPAALQPGCVARTGLHHMSVFVIRRANDHITLLGMRSLAGSLRHALHTAAHRLAT